jgi:predicted membrane channel-forming protein YqfA (hemolysin III family)
MEKSPAKKLLPSLFIFIGMITVGVNSIIKGIDQHQTWRIVLASISVVMFAIGIILIIIYAKKAQKVSA